MLVIGIDENGLGPQLGPLIVTGVAFETTSYNRDLFWTLSGPDLPADDSKVLFSRQRPGPGEEAFLSWLRLFDHAPTSFRELTDAICLPASKELPCNEIPTFCDPSTELRLPLWTDHSNTSIPLSVWSRFDKKNIRTKQIFSYAPCPGILNKELAKSNMNKFRYDFELMIRLIMNFQKTNQTEEIHALCGKVGSTKNYTRWFEEMGLAAKTIEELPEISTYELPLLGRISFIRDADSLHLPVAVASMIGKYLRELFMTQINRELGNGKREASGYRDKITRQFISDTADKRSRIGLPESCFVRNS